MQRERIANFLNSELNAVTENFGKKFSAPALHLLYESEEMFVGQFLKFEDGEMIVKFKASGCLPRKGEYVDAFYLPQSLQTPNAWKGKTYGDLYKNRIKSSEAACIWHANGREPKTIIGGFKGLDLSFSDYIKQTPGALVFFGPHRPPIDYLCNLYNLTKNDVSDRVSDILDYKYNSYDTIPILIKDNSLEFLYKQLFSTHVTILQGPPGTGKTQLIAELCERLCMEGKSVLVTALTNRALIEITLKQSCRRLLNEGRVLKSNLTYDEQEEVPGLTNLKKIIPIKGKLVLATFFQVSGYIKEMMANECFDVVIMDEASQALLPMFAVANKIGERNLWVGDYAQLGPVASLNSDRIKSGGYKDFVDGFTTLSEKRSFPLYQLTKTYRLPQRAADYTGIFYRNSLISEKQNSVVTIKSLGKILDPEGGPSLILTDMEVSNPAPAFAIDMAAYLVHTIMSENTNCEIAVLSYLRKTVRALQRAISLRLGIGNKVLIDTVSRVQGLTTDVTIFFVPYTSLNRSLEARLFNVATSRAKSHTIIIADKRIMTYQYLCEEVRTFLKKLFVSHSIYIPFNQLKHLLKM